jgi:MYXO-CTERM domain-containing protein
MDALPVGNAPDNMVPAGAWGFPANYVAAGIAEPVGREGIFTIVNSSIFGGGPGNSLHLFNQNGATTDNFHLPNIWSQSFTAAPGLILRVNFNLWVTDGSGGGSIYVGGDNGGGGFSNATGDRTAQISWTADGQVNAANNVGVNVPLHSYGFDGWQNIQIDIDTGNHNYNLFWSMGSDPLIQIGSNLMFRAPDPSLSVNYDRISFVQFGATIPSIDSYLDNVVVTPIPAPGAAALLGVGGLLALRRRRA